MHFWVSAARGGLYGQGCWPRKMGTNWFMPAFVKRRFGLSGMRLEEGTMVCCFDLKKSRNDWRISLLVIVVAPERRSDGSGENSRRNDQMPNTKCQGKMEELHREHRGGGTEGTEVGEGEANFR